MLRHISPLVLLCLVALPPLQARAKPSQPTHGVIEQLEVQVPVSDGTPARQAVHLGGPRGSHLVLPVIPR